VADPIGVECGKAGAKPARYRGPVTRPAQDRHGAPALRVVGAKNHFSWENGGWFEETTDCCAWLERVTGEDKACGVPLWCDCLPGSIRDTKVGENGVDMGAEMEKNATAYGRFDVKKVADSFPPNADTLFARHLPHERTGSQFKNIPSLSTNATALPCDL
jgi:hypothetical protein